MSDPRLPPDPHDPFTPRDDSWPPREPGHPWRGPDGQPPRRRERMFNLPPVLTWLAAIFLIILIVTLFLPHGLRWSFVLSFGFVPARVMGVADAELLAMVWGGEGLAPLTFLTYAFLHADFTHFLLNTIWMLAFGAPVARRLGTGSFLVFFFLCAAAGAGVHLWSNPEGQIPMVGASGAISGLMGAAVRFAVFRPHRWSLIDGIGGPPPVLPLTDWRVMVFSLFFVALNIAFAYTGFGITSEDQLIAWDAHLGGYFAGMFLFPLFDLFRQRRRL